MTASLTSYLALLLSATCLIVPCGAFQIPWQLMRMMGVNVEGLMKSLGVANGGLQQQNVSVPRVYLRRCTAVETTAVHSEIETMINEDLFYWESLEGLNPCLVHKTSFDCCAMKALQAKMNYLPEVSPICQSQWPIVADNFFKMSRVGCRTSDIVRQCDVKTKKINCHVKRKREKESPAFQKHLNFLRQERQKKKLMKRQQMKMQQMMKQMKQQQMKQRQISPRMLQHLMEPMF